MTRKTETHSVSATGKDTELLDFLEGFQKPGRLHPWVTHSADHVHIRLPVGHNQGSLGMSIRQLLDAARRLSPDNAASTRTSSAAQPKVSLALAEKQGEAK